MTTDIRYQGTTLKVSYQSSKKPNLRRDYLHSYYLTNRSRLLSLRKLHHLQTYQKKPSNSSSLFLKTREKNLLSILNKHHLTVPVPRFLKVKHPIISG